MYFPLNFLILLSTILLVSCRSSDWDHLIFTQSWPNTVCQGWEELGHSCRFPSEENLWTIHGIWPTKLNTHGPEFCNSSLTFNQTKIMPLYNELKDYWTDIYKDRPFFDLWKHEWMKHGTCAYSLPALQGEYRYFNQGLNWSHQLSIFKALDYHSIIPSDTNEYKIQDVWDAIIESFHVSPYIACKLDQKLNEWQLIEVRLCFNKALELIDCPSEQKRGTNCPLNKPIKYLKTNSFIFKEQKTDEALPSNEDSIILNLFYELMIFLKWIFFTTF